jgi:uncharacterized ubiquitin-like protein YukD
VAAGCSDPGVPRHPPISLPIVEIQNWKTFIKILSEELRSPPELEGTTMVILFDGAVVLERFWSRYLFPGAEFGVFWGDDETLSTCYLTALRTHAEDPASYSPASDRWSAVPTSQKFDIHLNNSSTREVATLRVSPIDLVQSVKEYYAQQKGCNPDSFKWRFKGRLLEDDRTLLNYGIADGDCIDLAKFNGSPEKAHRHVRSAPQTPPPPLGNGMEAVHISGW